MTASRGRGLNLVDLMIFVAATAIGIWIKPNALGDLMSRDTLSHTFPLLLLGLNHVVVPIWLAWTFAFLVIRLRRPRSGIREIVRQPGFAACMAASIFAIIDLSSELIVRARSGISVWPFCPASSSLQLHERLAAAVFGCWLTLVLNGCWRPEPGPVDRLGLLLGIGWICLYLAQIAALMLY